MGLYKRNETWWMSYTYEGQQRKTSTGTDDKRLAEKIYDILRGKLALGQWDPGAEAKQRFTFSELTEKYSNFKKSRLKSQKSVKSEEYTYSLLLESLGDFDLNDITIQKLEQMQSDWRAQGNKPATINRKFDVLRNMFVKAADWDMLSEDVLKRTRKVKKLKMSNQRLRYLSVKECIELVNACDTHLMPIVQFALNSGCRRGEILNLKWDNVDLKHGFISLTETKNGERRETPLNDTLRGVLQGLTRRLDVPYVFFDAVTGKPYGDVKRSFHTALRRAGIKDFHFHDLRHTFASHLVMAGVDITTLSKLLGHKSLTMTLRYSHLAPSHLQAGIKKLDGIFNPEKASFEGKKEANYTNFRTSSLDSKKEAV